MWDFLEVVADVLVSLPWWRFGLCLVASIAVAGVIYWRVPNQTLCMVLAAVILFVGIGAGILWERRSGS